jgi:ABC-2 type transport system permease protein
MLARILRHEWRTLLADRTLWAIGGILLAVVGYGAWNGTSWVRFQQATLRSAAAEEHERLETVKAGIRDADAGRTSPSSFSDRRTPAAVGRALGVRYASMPPGPLAALAIGQSDIYPYYFKVSTASKTTFLNNDEIEHPVHLMSGRFDLAFVVLYLYPLIILTLSYNLISAEKEAGTLAMTLAQPVSLRTVIAGKIALRFAFVLVVAAGLALAAVFLGGSGPSSDVAPRLGLWLAIVAAYGAFWFVLAAAVNALGWSSSTNAMALAGMWLTFVLLIPSLLNVAVKSLYPVPSRVELIQAMRMASTEASAAGSRLLARYYEDHPELADSRTSASDFAAVSLAAQEEVDRQVQPVLARFDEQLQRQQSMVDRYRFLSPAVVAQASLFDIAGTSSHRYQHFLKLVDGFHRAWSAHLVPRIVHREKLTPDDIDRLPSFQFREVSSIDVARRVAKGLAGLILPVVLIGLVFTRALRRFPIAG